MIHTPGLKHDTTVSQESKPTDRSWTTRFTATCSCGWVGRPSTSKEQAVTEADQHMRAMKRGERR